MTRGTRIHDSRIWSRAAMAAFVLAPAGAAPAQVTVQSVPATPLAPAQAVPVQSGTVQVVPAQPAGAATAPQTMPGTAAPAGAVVRPGTPGAPPEGAENMPGMPGIFSAAELAELKALYTAASEAEQEQLRAYYTDLGVDLEAALGITAARNAQIQRGQQIANAMRELDFARKPAAVLAARSKLGFGQVANPNPETAQPQDLARWLHLQTMAGEWGVLSEFLASRPAIESEPVYAAILQAMNRGDAGLLPEEVIALADASPGELKPWQMQAFGKMLQSASAKYSTGPMLAMLAKGTRSFGTATPEARRRTVELLVGAGLIGPAYEFLPPLEAARAAGDGSQMNAHGRYKLDLAEKAGDSPEADALRLEAWQIFCDVALIDRETLAVRREALKMAIDLMSRVPRAQAGPWLTKVFANPSLGPAALEALALAATGVGEQRLETEQRAQALLGLKEAVDLLLAREDIDIASLRVPLRMVTAALVQEMEQAVSRRGQNRMVAREAQLLLRAIPNEKWLQALEPSLASRARKACIALATTADETDQALAMLDTAIDRSPADAASFADDFLQKWRIRLTPVQEYPPEMMQYFAFYRDAMPMAPLTRGRQRRNLERLGTLLATLREHGVEARALPGLVPAFMACHASTEVYDRADIERVFGPIGGMPPATAAMLAERMGSSLNGDWRNRAAQKATGTKRSDNEIAALVDKGYGVAIDLADAAIAREPGSWELASMKAALTFDRMQFRQQQPGADAEKTGAYRQAAFDAFAQAATAYIAALQAGKVRDDPSIHLRWFGAAMGTAELNFLRVDDLPKEGTLQDDQVDLLRKSLQTLARDDYDRHMAAFAAAVQGAIERADPEVKPRLVHHALRVIGDHPAGAGLRAMQELYRDLVKDEIKLRLTLDGPDHVGVGKPFGVLVSLRYTHSVDRETGGFSKYLQNGVFGRVGNNYRQINYRDQVQKALEDAFTRAFDVQAIGFFDPFMPPRGVVEAGQDGWLEKPMAYVVLSRKEPVTDRLPSVTLDMQFTDQTGPVSLALPSNTPLLASGDDAAPRPVTKLEVAQLVDVRGAEGLAQGKQTVTLEVRVKGEGVPPALQEILQGVDAPLAGYTLGADGIAAAPMVVMQAGDAAMPSRFGMMSPSAEPKDGYPEADSNGIFHLPIERTYTVTYTRAGGDIGSVFTLPVLRPGVDATLESRAYADLDIVPVKGSTVAVAGGGWTQIRLVIAAALAALLGGAVLLARHWTKRREAAPAPAWAPARLTPLGVVTSLRRLERERGAALEPARAQSLREEIVGLESRLFGPQAQEASEPELRAVVERWQTVAGAR
ncbi:MAG: hypothetical protein U0625_06685 [Phycisphaerales bacterium]